MNKNIQIFLVGHSLMTGGAEKKMLETAQYLTSSNYQIKILLFKSEIQLNMSAEVSKNIIVLGNGVSIKSIRNLDDLISKSKPKIVMGFLGHVNVILGMIKKKHQGISFIGRENATYREYFNDKGFIAGRILKLAYKMNLKKLDRIVFQSEYARTEAIEAFGISKDQTTVIANPLSRVNDRKRNKRKKIKLLSVGRLDKVKNQKDMIDVVKLLPPNFELIFIGSGEEEINLKEYAEKLGIAHRVLFKGTVEDVTKYYLNCDFLLITSFRETFPNVALEATSNGLPIISYDIPGGIKEIVENNVNGFIVPWGKIDEMSNTIKSNLNFKSSIPPKLYDEKEYFKKVEEIFIYEMGRQS